MGLKCSVLGHAYGETTVERDREERGSEVVITIRELETCDRCGDTRVVTENKEVTTIETQDDAPDVTAADAVAAMDEDAAADPADPAQEGASNRPGQPADTPIEDAETGGAADAPSPSPDAVEDQGAEILDAEADADASPVDDELADPTIENDADVPGESTEEEDAVILDDDAGAGADAGTDADAETDASAGGESGAEAADAADAAPADEPSSSDAGAAETGPFDPPPDDEDDEPLGEWPEETLRDDDDGWTPTEDLTGTVDDIDPDADVDRTLSTDAAVTVPEGEFHCGECGYTTPVEASSLRAGDYCPECHRGTLVHRTDS